MQRATAELEALQADLRDVVKDRQSLKYCRNRLLVSQDCMEGDCHGFISVHNPSGFEAANF
jgi:hypothetical protein